MEKLQQESENKMKSKQRALEERQALKEIKRNAVERKRMKEKTQKIQQAMQVRLRIMTVVIAKISERYFYFSLTEGKAEGEGKAGCSG